MKDLNHFSFKIAFIYAFIGGLWILFSDELLSSMVSDPQLLTRLQTYKGWIYVFATAGMLYFLINRNLMFLRESEERYSNLFYNNHAAMLLIDPDTKIIVDANSAACNYYGYTKADFASKTIFDIDTLPNEEVLLEMEQAKNVPCQHLYYRHRLAGGQLRDVEVYRGMIKVDGKELLYALIHDISERKQAEDALKRERDKAQKYLDVAGVMLLVIGADQRVSLINKQGCAIIGCQEKDILGRNWFDNFLPERVKEENRSYFKQIINGDENISEYYEKHILTKTGKEKLIAWHTTLLKDEEGQIIATLSSGEDVTERSRLREELRLMSITDELTGLANRRGFFNQAQEQISMAKANATELVLLFVDLDDLKAINDTFGHYMGDQALRESAQILRETYPKSNVIARLGGDEFAVLLPITDKKETNILIYQLQENLAAYNNKGKRPYRLSISAGYVPFKSGEDASLDELLAKADWIMYKNKRNKERQA